MKHESLWSKVVGSMLALLWAALLVTAVEAQEPPGKTGGDPPDKPAAAEGTPRKAPRGRLPAYFGKVVNDKQRDEIYDIQAKYNEQIDELKKELESLIAKRDKEVEDVLTDEQRAEIARMKAERRAQRSGNSAGDTSSGGD